MAFLSWRINYGFFIFSVCVFVAFLTSIPMNCKVFVVVLFAECLFVLLCAFVSFNLCEYHSHE